MNKPQSRIRSPPYRGRLAPSPTGYLHLGHARTFWIAQERARANRGVLVLRNEDLDRARCKPEFVAAMQITEVARGADLLKSTDRQILLYRALDWEPPAFYHCPLMTDAAGLGLAKRQDALSLRAWRERGQSPEWLRCSWTTLG